MSESAAYRFEDLTEGLSRSHTYVISAEHYKALVDVFGDRSPIHIDEAAARVAGFDGPVMHGAILQGFVSHFIGMVLPGSLALLQSVELRYLKPLSLGDTVGVQATVAQTSAATRSVVLDLVVTNVDQKLVVARGRAQVGIRRE